MPQLWQPGPRGRKGPRILVRQRFTLADLYITNNAGGGTDGTTVTTGNSGGISGTAFQNVIIASAITYSGSHSVSTPLGYKWDTTAATGTNRFQWDLTNIPVGFKTMFGRVYAYFETAFTNAAAFEVYIDDLNAVHGIAEPIITVDGSGNLRMDDAAGTTQGGPYLLSLGVLYRFEWKVFSHASAGTEEVRIYAGNSLTPLTTLAATGLNTGGFDIQQITFRQNRATTAGITYLDDFGASSLDWMGPTGVDAAAVTSQPAHPKMKRSPRGGGPPILSRQQFPSYDAVVAGNVVVNVDTPGAITWTGQAVGLTSSVAVTAGAITWTGSTVGLTLAIAPTAGAITWTGQATPLTSTVQPTAGAITWTGQTVGLKLSLGLVAGAITWNGSTVGLTSSLGVTAGAVTWAGSVVGLKLSVGVVAGAIVWNGSAVTLVTGGQTIVNVDVPGAITWTGSTVGLKLSVAVAAGAIVWTGSTVVLLTGTTVVVSTPGAITWAGQAVGLRSSVLITAGGIVWTGSTVTAVQLSGLGVLIESFDGFKTGGAPASLEVLSQDGALAGGAAGIYSDVYTDDYPGAFEVLSSDGALAGGAPSGTVDTQSKDGSLTGGAPAGSVLVESGQG